MPDFSTTRSFPGVGVGVGVGADASSKAPFGVLKSWASGEGTPPTIPSTMGNWPPLIRVGRANIVRNAERRSISSEEQRASPSFILISVFVSLVQRLALEQ